MTTSPMRQPRLRLFLRAGSLILWAGWSSCLCDNPVGGGNSTVPGKCSDNAPRVDVQKTDILFVVDDSNSMAAKQDAVARELPAFVQALQAGAGVQQDFQMGVVTTSIYQNVYLPSLNQTFFEFYPTKAGHLQAVPPSTDGGDVITVDGGGTMTCASGETVLSGGDQCLVNKFARLVHVGVNGSGQETPFEAARLATTAYNSVLFDAGGNGGFLRDQAQLLVVTVMDEDDCSELVDITDGGWRPQVSIGVDKNQAPNFTDYCTNQSAKLASVQYYSDFFKGMHDDAGEPRLVIWADIGPVSLADKSAAVIQFRDGGASCSLTAAGTNENVDCPTSCGAGFRHHDLAALFDSTLGDIDSICDASFHQALLNIAARTVAGQTIRVSGIPDPGLLIVSITRADGSVQNCTINGTDVTSSPNDNITFSTTPSGQEIIQFHGACERRVDDQALTVTLLCVD